MTLHPNAIARDDGVLLLHATTPSARSGLHDLLRHVRAVAAVRDCRLVESAETLSARVDIVGPRTTRTVLPGSTMRGKVEVAAPMPGLLGELHWRRAHGRLPRLAILVSGADHGLWGLLSGHARGELPVEIAAVISDRAHVAELVNRRGLRLHRVDMARDPDAAFRRLAAITDAARVDIIADARFAPALPAWLLASYARRLITVQRAMSATRRPLASRLHCASAHLRVEHDAPGPCLSAESWTVSGPGLSPLEMSRLSRPFEAAVLADAVRAVAEDRVLITGDGGAVVLPRCARSVGARDWAASA